MVATRLEPSRYIGYRLDQARIDPYAFLKQQSPAGLCLIHPPGKQRSAVSGNREETLSAQESRKKISNAMAVRPKGVLQYCRQYNMTLRSFDSHSVGSGVMVQFITIKSNAQPFVVEGGRHRTFASEPSCTIQMTRPLYLCKYFSGLHESECLCDKHMRLQVPPTTVAMTCRCWYTT